MTGCLAHRGPDDQGLWIDPEAGIGLGHRRLSIVDLSPLGHQPMHSACERFTLCFNGEIYNHLDLRIKLQSGGKFAGAWRGNSDTETLLECIAAWGLEETLQQSVGMFAFALWDKQTRRLQLVRDRFGEKPLYYGWVSKNFVFASELKAIKTLPGFSNPINRDALRLYSARGYVPSPHSIYQDIYKLRPGQILSVPSDSAWHPVAPGLLHKSSSREIYAETYWSYLDVVRQGLERPVVDHDEALDGLDKVLADAIRGQSVADVPVGAFLSGGIDSSTVVALYQKYTSRPVNTFSIGFDESAFNEAHFAKEVAAYFGTSHNELYVTPQQAQEVIPYLPAIYDEPFADSSQIPTYLVSRFAREQVTVALSGDGGDELFAGYNRHFLAPRMWNQMQRVPPFLRRTLAGPLSMIPEGVWDRLSGVLPGGRQPRFGTKVRAGLRLSQRASTLQEVYMSFLDEWHHEGSPVIGPAIRNECEHPMQEVAPGAPATVSIMHYDAVSYLPDDILCKVDRAAMAVSLETRVPFLDHRVAEFAARIPIEMKVRNSQGKQILRELLYRHAPRRLFERPKAGFGIPVGKWLKGPLRPWAEALIDRKRMSEQGFFNPEIVHQRWRAHLNSNSDFAPAIWGVLMFQAWLEQAERPSQ
jgi:asparagine synthase (glutamine-hydrolysing)